MFPGSSCTSTATVPSQAVSTATCIHSRGNHPGPINPPLTLAEVLQHGLHAVRVGAVFLDERVSLVALSDALVFVREVMIDLRAKPIPVVEVEQFDTTTILLFDPFDSRVDDPLERERLEKQWDAGGVPGDRDDHVRRGLDSYNHSLRHRLIWLVYIIPTVTVVTLVWILNFD